MSFSLMRSGSEEQMFLENTHEKVLPLPALHSQGTGSIQLLEMYPTERQGRAPTCEFSVLDMRAPAINPCCHRWWVLPLVRYGHRE